MPWPLYILGFVILLVILAGLLPSLLLNPKKHLISFKQKREKIIKAQNKEDIFCADMKVYRAPSMISYCEVFIKEPLVRIHFKEDCIYFRALGFWNYVYLYEEIDMISVSYSEHSVGLPVKITFHMKDKSRSNLIFKTGRKNEVISEIREKINIPIIKC